MALIPVKQTDAISREFSQILAIKHNNLSECVSLFPSLLLLQLSRKAHPSYLRPISQLCSGSYKSCLLRNLVYLLFLLLCIFKLSLLTPTSLNFTLPCFSLLPFKPNSPSELFWIHIQGNREAPGHVEQAWGDAQVGCTHRKLVKAYTIG